MEQSERAISRSPPGIFVLVCAYAPVAPPPPLCCRVPMKTQPSRALAKIRLWTCWRVRPPLRSGPLLRRRKVCPRPTLMSKGNDVKPLGLPPHLYAVRAWHYHVSKRHAIDGKQRKFQGHKQARDEYDLQNVCVEHDEIRCRGRMRRHLSPSNATRVLTPTPT